MPSIAARVPLSPVGIAGIGVAVLALIYLTLIAVIMTYATLTVEFAQSVRNDEAQIAALESRYLDAIAELTSSDYASLGYAKPLAQTYVPAQSVTALR